MRCSVCGAGSHFYCRSCRSYFCTVRGCPVDGRHHPAVEVYSFMTSFPMMTQLQDFFSGRITVEEYRKLPSVPPHVTEPMLSKNPPPEEPHRGRWSWWQRFWCFR